MFCFKTISLPNVGWIKNFIKLTFLRSITLVGKLILKMLVLARKVFIMQDLTVIIVA